MALAVVLIGAFFGLAAADRTERFAAAAREHDAIVALATGSVHSAFDQDTRLLDRLAAAPDDATVQGLLNLAPALVPGVQAAAVLDQDGTVVAQAPDGPAGRAFETIAAAARSALTAPGAPGLFVSAPVHDADRGLDLVGLARTRTDADGHVAGLAVIATDAASLAPPVSLPRGGALTIRRNDGTLLFRAGDGNAAGAEAAAVPAYPLEVSYGRPAGETWREWRAAWLRNGALVGGVGLFVGLAAVLADRRRRRITARNAATRAGEALALRRDVADLAAAARDADAASRAKSRFFAQVTHELRTPLNAIIGFSETIKGEMFGPVVNQRYLDYAGLIHDAGGHLLSLINDLLDISKLEEGKMEIAPIRVSAAALARSTLDLVDLLARDRNVALSSSGIDSCPDLCVDPRAAKQVLVNLLSNAIKFTLPGGRIEVAFAGRADGGVAITVADSGIGMSAEEIAMAFEPFGRASGEFAAKTPGTGLGLPIARALVRLHGGELSLSSAPGCGTTATVLFPAEAGAARLYDAVIAVRAA